MLEIRLRTLPAPLRPLLSKFYRSCNSSMRPPREAHYWVAERRDIVAGLCLTPVAHGHWLTGLLVTATERQQGLASELVRRALADTEGSVWLFCHPQLQAFYARLGFAPAQALPEPLAARLERYRRSKALVALCLERGIG